MRTGVYQRYGELLQQALATDLPDVQVRLRTSEGSQQNLQRLADGVSDFTIATADSVDKFRKDNRPGADRLRGCARLYDDYVQLVVPQNSPVRSVADLRGKRVAVGQDGSGVRLLADRLLAAAGLDPLKDITPVPAGIDTMPELLRDKQIDAFFWSGGLPTTAVLKLSQAYPIRLVPLARPGRPRCTRRTAAPATTGRRPCRPTPTRRRSTACPCRRSPSRTCWSPRTAPTPR